jgi:hypothetical protein
MFVLMATSSETARSFGRCLTLPHLFAIRLTSAYKSMLRTTAFSVTGFVSLHARVPAVRTHVRGTSKLTTSMLKVNGRENPKPLGLTSTEGLARAATPREI